MAVITITIEESEIQKMAGIPKFITLTTNIVSSIFYTFDGTDPTTLSSIAEGQITLPTDIGWFVFKAFATNGVDTSVIISNSYGSNIVGNRVPRATSIGVDVGDFNSANFGAPNINPNVTYGNIGGVVVDDPSLEQIPDGYDGTGTGTPSTYTNDEYVLHNYEIEYSERNRIGEYGKGIGTLPSTTKVVDPVRLNTSPDANSKLFNPKSMVIIQDGRLPQEDPNIVCLNRQFFSLKNPEKDDYVSLYNSALEGNPLTGTFLRQHFNPKENTITYYYRDSATNRWIISIEPVTQKVDSSILSQILLPVTSFAAKKVFRWIPFSRRNLG